MQRRVGQRHQRAQAVVAAGELDHDQDVVVAGAFLLRRIHGARERIRYGGVPGGEARRAGAEDQAGFQEVTALELVDAYIFLHRSRTYLSWNSGEARVTNQRPRSSAAWFRSVAV